MMGNDGRGEVYATVAPRCPTHGQMHFDMPCDMWRCRGFDGEGCEYMVAMEDIQWEHIGWIDTDQAVFRYPWERPVAE